MPRKRTSRFRHGIFLKRVYEMRCPNDGVRVLVDRIWPRGFRKEDAEIDVWLKDIAPSTELRRWFQHDVARWPEFDRRYRQELEANERSLAVLEDLSRRGPITLVFAAADVAHNNAVVLLAYLKQRICAGR
ncbi:DUF488 domain-containing protein [Hyphomicrobium sp.]|uniref:DUF488 domain-containing protein n=1 Tax=Hyphomicrobium sp. TaxID=82 RepID=UPI002CF3FE12|nr:DUF488 domain-containing protein [Hyphomicrobium sp.]HRN87123.1 DUF488 domain-containing protein [Hyphomicrobium sp.]HRQ25502.1 DUF488 domain-containing protein [Hyphomicrobium sp.]